MDTQLVVPEEAPLACRNKASSLSIVTVTDTSQQCKGGRLLFLFLLLRLSYVFPSQLDIEMLSLNVLFQSAFGAKCLTTRRATVPFFDLRNIGFAEIEFSAHEALDLLMYRLNVHS